MDPGIVAQVKMGEQKLSISKSALMRGENEAGHSAAVEAFELFSDVLNKSVPQDLSLHCLSKIATASNLMGIACNNTREYPGGATAFTNAIKIWQEFIRLGHDESFNVLIGKSNLASSLAGLGIRNEAIELLKSVINGLKELNQEDTRKDLIRCLSELARILTEDTQLKPALQAIEEAIAIISLGNLGMELALANGYNTKGKILRELNALPQSCDACEKAILLLGDIGKRSPSSYAPYMEVFLCNYRKTIEVAKVVESESVRKVRRIFFGAG